MAATTETLLKADNKEQATVLLQIMDEMTQHQLDTMLAYMQGYLDCMHSTTQSKEHSVVAHTV